MRRLLIQSITRRVPLLMLLCGVTTAGQTMTAPSHSAQTPPHDRLRDALRAHVEFLADDLLEGRGAAARGYWLAANYVAAQFKQWGLKPGGDSGSYFQNVPLLEATPVLPGSTARLTRDDESIDFEYNTDYLPSADFTAPASSLSAPLAFAGFGVTASELGYDDLAQVDVQGRVAVVFSGAPAKFAPAERAYYSWNGSKLPNLIANGAVGVIIVDTPEDSERMPWERRVTASWQPQMRWLDADSKPVDAYAELKQRFRFNRDAAAKLFVDALRTLEEALAAAAAGEPQGFALPGVITLSTTTGLRRTDSSNVIAILEGIDPHLKHEYVIVTAHLDHLGRGKAVHGDAIYNGAHDNALGVAILLETARALATAPRVKRSIVFAAVTAEEKGSLGSDYFAAHPPVDRQAMIANINIDMPQLFAPTRDIIALGAEHSTLGSSIARAAKTQGYLLSPDDLPGAVRLIHSDQFSFVRRGIPALSLMGGYLARNANVDVSALRREFLRHHYHQPSDDLSLPIDYGGAADFVRICVRLTSDIANQPSRPRWLRHDFLASKFNTRP